MRILCYNWEAPDDAVLERKAFPEVELTLWRSASEGPPLEACATADAIINCSAARPLNRPPAAFSSCRIVVQSGVGFDRLDVKGFADLDVPVCNVPDYGTTEVADHALALALSLTRGTAVYDDALRQEGTWAFDRAPLVMRLRGATFGIVGLGRIGLATARRAAAFDMRIVFYDPYLSNGVELSTGYDRVHSLAELMAVSDIVSLHTPLTEETRGLIGTAALAAAKPGIILVNTARGSVVDLDALQLALRRGHVAGAALDVLPIEPADPAHPLVKAWRAREPWIDGRLMLTPHAAFFSPASLRDLRRKSIEVALAYIRDGRLINCVNSHLLASARRGA